MQQRITPNLWFATEAEEPASFYVSVFPASRIELDGQRFVGINGGPDFTFDELSLLGPPARGRQGRAVRLAQGQA
jgi:predicted 3-demethylubiquinone-9 3-methyltransferase (glyoxalase superfamily)